MDAFRGGTGDVLLTGLSGGGFGELFRYRGRRNRALAAAAVPTVSVQEKEQEAFSLTVDEQGLRSDWRSPEENGSLRIDVNNGGLQIRAKGTSAVDAASAGSEPSKRCTCDCGCGH